MKVMRNQLKTLLILVFVLVANICSATKPFKFTEVEKSGFNIEKSEYNFDFLNIRKDYNKVCSKYYQSLRCQKKRQEYMEILYTIKDFGYANRINLRYDQCIDLKFKGRVDVFSGIYTVKLKARFDLFNNKFSVKAF